VGNIGWHGQGLGVGLCATHRSDIGVEWASWQPNASTPTIQILIQMDFILVCNNKKKKKKERIYVEFGVEWSGVLLIFSCHLMSKQLNTYFSQKRKRKNEKVKK